MLNEFDMNLKKQKKEKNFEVEVKWRLFGYLAWFVLFILMVVWIFQVILLNVFYENAKKDENERITTALCEKISDGYLNEIAYGYAIQNRVCIRIFRVDDNLGIAHEVVSADAMPDCVIHHSTSEQLSGYYENAVQNGGEYMLKRSIFPDIPTASEYLDDHGKIISNISVKITYGDDGREYVIMLNSHLTPVNAIVDTLNLQFLWIGFVLFIGALILASLISRKISKPIVEMNKAAKKLAKGDYEADFKGEGYLEAVELANSLNYASSELSKTDKLQKDLIANISHDIRTPLTMIKGYAEVMRDIPGENSPENIQVIIDETSRLNDLVSDILDLSRTQSGTRKPQKEIINLTDTIRQAMTRYDRLISKDGFEIDFTTQNGEAYVNADKGMMLQVIYNFINNAVNYSLNDKRVEVLQTISNGKVRISVKDHGEGIEPDKLPFIWDRYYKVDKVHKRTVVGSGLGLAIVKGILESHGATYGVDSALGKGSTFWFELPVLRDENLDD